MALDADSARLLATDEDVVLQHEIADILEANAVLIKRLVVLGRDAVQHFRGVESSCDAASPAFALQKPAQQDGKNLVWIDEVAIFVHRAKTIRVAIGDEASLAFLCDNRVLQCEYVGLDWL